MPKLTDCKCCKKRVSNEADACPHCGQPFPAFIEEKKVFPQIGEVLVGLASNGAILLELRNGAWTTVSSSDFSPPLNPEAFHSLMEKGDFKVRVIESDCDGLLRISFC